MRGPHKRILVVEDEPKVANILRQTLEEAGFTVSVAGTGAEALAAVGRQGADLAILDLLLPDMSGYDVAKQLRQAHCNWALPILMVTALDSPIDKMRGFASGADAYVSKPFDTGEVLGVVETLLQS